MQFSFSFKSLTLTTLLWVALITKIDCFNFNFTNFNDEDSARNQLILSSNSTIFLGAIQVTPDANGAPKTHRSGRTLYKKPFKLWSNGFNASFNTTFVLNIQSQTNPGGEGLAFILTANSVVNDISDDGQWLDIIKNEMNGSSSAQTVAIEFVTSISYPEDLDDNHVGLDINSINSRVQFPLTKVGLNLTSGKDNNVRVEYNGQLKELTVFVGNVIKPVLSENLDLSVYLPEKIFVGFSGSTSNYTQLNCVKSWTFNGTEKGDEHEPFWVWILVPLLGVLLLFGIGYFIYWKRKSEREKLADADAYPISIEEAIQGSSTAPRKLKMKELSKATNGFSSKNKLGKGGFGTVYKGMIKDKEIAVKKVSKKSTQGKTEFIAEVTTIGNLRHKNLVKLIGWCYERREYLLVYEYLPNGSLEKYIFDESASDVLGWKTRLSVITGTAQALDYLHNGCEEKILHRDIKSSNIMLDSEFNPKLGDFGLARTIKLSDQTHHTTKEVAGTPGYMAPESILTSRFTVETDVYAFGVVILEVACGRKPGSPNHQDDYIGHIVNWVWDLHKKGRIIDAADKRLQGDFEDGEMEIFLTLGLACCHPNPNKRPNMKIVLQVLKGEALPPPVPNERPVFMWPPLPPSFKELDISLGQFTPFSDIHGR
ncbi:hypothetical protein JCGZ_25550 [Jatropha curcas]|uniref:Protein kinase domain-containing protein n=1 Tax=Jatropha curcas TaxID=180498 RepID=A0A067JYM5_JATCU|nr:hypothetical protein JCGZ_25550 [Jatropha curcas]